MSLSIRDEACWLLNACASDRHPETTTACGRIPIGTWAAVSVGFSAEASSLACQAFMGVPTTNTFLCWKDYLLAEAALRDGWDPFTQPYPESQ